MSILQRLEAQAPLCAAVVAAIVYGFTIAPTFSHTDGGELSAVCYTFGVAHPTGYPLFTLLGGLFSHIPLASPAFMLNVLALLLTAGGVYWWGRTLDTLFASIRIKVKEGDTATAQRIRWARLSALLAGTLLLAFSRTYWAQSTAAEVYSLHAFLLTLNLFLLFRAWEAPLGAPARKAWLWFAFALALAFSNHLTTIVLLPGVAWLYFRKHHPAQATTWKQLGLMLALFFPILIALYAWLPIRASMDPTFAWGNPQTTEEIWHHVSGKQFSVWMFTGQKAFQTNLGRFFSSLPLEFAYASLLLVLPGLWYGFQIRRDILIFSVLAFASTIFWAANYSIKDPEPYFLLALIMITLWVALGLRWIWLRLQAQLLVRRILTTFAAITILLALTLNFTPNNQRNAWQYEDYTRAALQSLPQNALVISISWDIFVSPSYYLQYVEGIRPDIDIVEYNMLHDRHWYADHLRHHAPELAATLGPRLDIWEATVQDFDLRDIIDVARLSSNFAALYSGILEQAATRPLSFSPEMKSLALNGQSGAAIPRDWVLVPEQYFYRLTPPQQASQYIPTTIGLYPLRLPNPVTLPVDILLVQQLQDILSIRLQYEQFFQKPEQAAQLQALLSTLPPVQKE